MKKKNMKAKSINVFLGGLMVLLVGCNKFTPDQSKFNLENEDQFKAKEYKAGSEAIPAEELEVLLNAMGIPNDDDGEGFTTDWYYYSWQASEPFSEFVIYNSHECGWDFYYVVYDGSRYVSHKRVSGGVECGDYLEYAETSIIGGEFSHTRTGQSIGDVYNTETIEVCRLVDGVFTCDQSYNVYPGISLWNGLALRESPDRNGKFITRVNIGERFTSTDSAEIDQESEYIYIELLGGQQGHILKNLVQTKAIPFAIKYDAIIHSRPDELTRTDKVFKRMDLVAVSETEEGYEWVKVRGRSPGDKWFKEGWIKTSNGTQNELDVAVAALVNRALSEEDVEKRHALLREIYNNPEFENSYLRDYISNFLPGV